MARRTRHTRRSLALFVALCAFAGSAATADRAYGFEIGFASIELDGRTSVDLGESFTLEAAWGDPAVPDGFDVYMQFFAPPQTTITAVRPSDGGGSCSLVSSQLASCVVRTLRGSAALSIDLDATETANDVEFRFDAELPEIGGAAATATLDVVDPAITADLSTRLELAGVVAVGESVDGTLTVVNHGPTDMADTQVIITTSDELALTAAQIGSTVCSIATGTATCDLGTLTGHADVGGALSLTALSPASTAAVIARVSSTTPQDDPDPHPDETTASMVITAEPAADLGVVVWETPTTPVVGLRSTMRITVTNDGPAPTTATLTGSLSGNYPSASLRTNRIFPSPACRFHASGAIECDAFAIAARQSVEWTFSFVPADTSEGKLRIEATGALPEPSPDPTSNHDDRLIPAADPATADFEVTIDGPDDPYADTAYWFDIDARNNGPWLVDDAVLHIELPEMYEIDYLGAGGSLDCETRPGSLTCTNTRTIRVDRLMSINLSLVATETGPSAPIIATVTTELPDPDGATAEFSADFRSPTADLKWMPDGDLTELRVGVATDHTLATRNLGPAAASDARMEIDVPDGVEVSFRGVSAEECSLEPDGDAICELGRIPARYYDYVHATFVDTLERDDATYTATVTSSTPLPADATDPYPRTLEWTVDTLPALSARVHGVATSSDAPVAGTKVLAFPMGSGFAPSEIETVASDGSYEFEDLDAGFYRFVFVPPEGSPLAPTRYMSDGSRRAGRLIKVPGDGLDVNLGSERVDTQATISGTLVDNDGQPVAGARVIIFHRYVPWLPYGESITAADGTYAVTGFQGGSYVAWFSKDGQHTWWRDADWNHGLQISVGSGEERTGIDATIELE